MTRCAVCKKVIRAALVSFLAASGAYGEPSPVREEDSCGCQEHHHVEAPPVGTDEVARPAAAATQAATTKAETESAAVGETGLIHNHIHDFGP